MDYQQLTEEAVKETASLHNFVYYGDLPIGKTWAFTTYVHRDSHLLDESNFEVISKDMKKRYPTDVNIAHCNHWAVGWIDHLTVRMLNDKGDVTQAGKAILDWNAALSDYPVADDMDYSQREWEERMSAYDDWARYDIERIVKENNIRSLLDEDDWYDPTGNQEDQLKKIVAENLGYTGGDSLDEQKLLQEIEREFS